MKKLIDDCFLHDKDRMRHDEAIALLRERITTIVGENQVPLEYARGRVLSQTVTAPRNVPAFDNAAVDGYAFTHADHDRTGGFFPIAARVAAGETQPPSLPGFSSARIFTGAPMPNGSETVAMQEDCETLEKDGKPFVRIPFGLKPGANCRRAGEDVAEGEAIAQAGKILSPQYIAAIASTGTNQVTTYSPLNVGLLSSGDEILRPGEAFRQGAVYDANHFMLASLMDHPSIMVGDLGICPDVFDEVCDLFGKASQEHDVIITTGGASRGEEDHVIHALEELGNCHMWQLAVKPGRPMAFGQIGSVPVFVLPGNPVAAFVCFLLYVRPALLRLAGAAWPESTGYRVSAGFSLKSKPDRREFLRGWIENGESGKSVARKFERDGSGLISGLRRGTGLVVVDEETTTVREGDTITFLPFSELMA